jgi:hypothetical protein
VSQVAEESGQDRFAARHRAVQSGLEIVGDDAEALAQIENIPVLFAENPAGAPWSRDRITFPRKGLDEGGFPRPVRPEDNGMFADGNLQRQVSQRRPPPAQDGHLLKIKQQWSCHSGDYLQ